MFELNCNIIKNKKSIIIFNLNINVNKILKILIDKGKSHFYNAFIWIFLIQKFSFVSE